MNQPTNDPVSALRAALDRERRAAGPAEEPGRLVHEWSSDRSESRVVFSACPPDRLAETVLARRDRARAEGHALEWKVYAHDDRPGLPTALEAAGFTAEDAETVLAVALGPAAKEPGAPVPLLPAESPACEIRSVRDEAGLADLARISRAIGRRNVEAETRQLAARLADGDGSLSIHIAYVGGQPASCGRLQYGRTEGFAELAGGRTVPEYRRRGLFTALVAARLHEAERHGCEYAFVDALPTSEPILTRCGFIAVTETRPYVYEA